MRVLVACECSGVVRDAFAARGHDAWSCDIVPAERNHSVQHIRADVLTVLDHGWDMMIAFPPCTYLCNAGLHFCHNPRFTRRRLYQAIAINRFMRLAEHPSIPFVAVENPIGIMSTIYRKPDQIVGPWQFGNQANKPTCLWLRGLATLSPTKIVGHGRFYVRKNGKRDSVGLNDTSSKTDPAVRSRRKSRTFPGIAAAMAEQWG